jgi:hypothetical protein
MPPSRVVFDAPHHPVMVVRRVFFEDTRKSFGKEFFPSSSPSLLLGNHGGHCKKKKI